MTDGDALHAAILAAPDDDTPRLVYADWLDENGQPERAEFIRVQVTLAHAPTLALQVREARLLTANGESWRSSLHRKGGPLQGEAHGQFRRGFVEVVWMSARRFLERGGDLLASVPLRELRVTGASEEDFRQLLTSPFLRGVVALDLSDRQLRDPAVRQILWSPIVGWLRVLRLRGCNITDRGVRWLAGTQIPCAFTELDVSHNPISAAALATLRKRYGEAVIAEGMLPPE